VVPSTVFDLTGILADQPPPDETIRWLVHAGIITRRVEDTACVLEVLATRTHETPSNLRVGIATNVRGEGDVSDPFETSVDAIRCLGHHVIQTAAPLHDLRTGVGSIERDRAVVAERVFKDIDLLLLPTTPEPTPSVEAARTNPLALSAENTAFSNYYGLAAISVPCGFDRRGLPLGIQIVGRPGDDASVLRLAAQYQHATDHHRVHPETIGIAR
jgi:aspartyl-tRNA(Asn)/glutamyl-tRNA(Gln) amidotransferase subunit A